MKSALPLTALSALAITAFAQLTACSAPTTGDNTTPNETQMSESSLGPKTDFDPFATIKVIPINNCVKQVVQTINGRLVIIETLECATSVLGCQAEAQAIAAGAEVAVVSASGTTTAGTVVSTTAGAGGAITVTIMVGSALIVVTALCLVTGAHETAAGILSTNNPVADPNGTGPTNDGLKCAEKTSFISLKSYIEQCRECCDETHPWPGTNKDSCYAGCNLALQ